MMNDENLIQFQKTELQVWKNNQVLDPREIIPEYKEKDVSIRKTRE